LPAVQERRAGRKATVSRFGIRDQVPELAPALFWGELPYSLPLDFELLERLKVRLERTQGIRDVLFGDVAITTDHLVDTGKVSLNPIGDMVLASARSSRSISRTSGTATASAGPISA
jgi:hypothetical protein